MISVKNVLISMALSIAGCVAIIYAIGVKL